MRSVPKEKGLYFFYTDTHRLFMGVCEDLRIQIERHIQVPEAGTRIIPAWADVKPLNGKVCLAYFATPGLGASKREHLKSEHVPGMKPRLNYVCSQISSLLGAA